YSNARPGSYANVVNGAPPGSYGSLLSTSPAMVLEDTWLVVRDLSKHVMGKVKDFTAIPRLYTILKDEGFLDVKLNYLGGTWVLFEFCNNDTKEEMGRALDLEDNVDTSFGCKRLCVKIAHPVLISETFKIIVKGIVFMVRAKELFTWNPSFIDNKEKDYTSEEDSDFVPNNNDPNNHINEEVFGDVYGSDDDGVPETVFGSNTSSLNQDNVTSESRPSLSHPHVFTPEGVVHHEMLGTVNMEADNNGGKDNPIPVRARVMNTSQDISKEMHSDSVGSKTVHNGGSMLEVMEDFIRIGQAMGYAIVKPT
nr:RNA-directed DNA polymerase, eukaryota [Tanacetum cinerariifolium]